MPETFDVAVIGAGPAGLAAAAAAAGGGASPVVLDRETHLGGILQQCIHPGFGLLDFQEELTGPEYAERLIQTVKERKIPIKLEHMVLRLEPLENGYMVVASNRQGLARIQAKTVVLAMGCRERTRGQIRIPGTRPAGIYTAGTAQRWINIEGFHVGQRVVVLGSGDIGLIMARRLTLEGAQVPAVAEILPYESGLKRNVVQCLEDFDIPLLLGHTVTEIHGRDRVEGVTLSRVDGQLCPVEGTAEYWPCDTLLLSVGLIPENELSRALGVELDPLTGGARVDQWGQTNWPGVFSCGNVLHVNDLVDRVAQEGARVGAKAALAAVNGKEAGAGRQVSVLPQAEVRYTVPQKLRFPVDKNTPVSLRVTRPMPRAHLAVEQAGTEVFSTKLHWARPGEMITFDLPGQYLQPTGDIIVTVCEEDGE